MQCDDVLENNLFMTRGGAAEVLSVDHIHPHAQSRAKLSSDLREFTAKQEAHVKSEQMWCDRTFTVIGSCLKPTIYKINIKGKKSGPRARFKYKNNIWYLV